VQAVVFVMEKDATALRAVVGDLTRRFGNDFVIKGESSPDAATAAWREMAAAGVPVALLLVDASSCDLLDCAHDLHPHARRVLLIDRDYTSTSPAVQALATGRADYHLVRPWVDDEVMYRAMSDYLSSWTQEQDPSLELFRLIADENDPRAVAVRDAMTRLSLPFRFYPLGSESAAQVLEDAGLDNSDLPVVIRYDGCVTVNPTLSDMAQAFGVNVVNKVDTCDVVIVGGGPDGGGRDRLEHLTLADRARDTFAELPPAALFVMIGGEPHTQWLPDEIARSREGYVLTGREILEHPGAPSRLERDPLPLETTLPGVFAAGDVRNGSIKRVASAVGEGASVVRLIHEYLPAVEPEREPAGSATG
jgi:hypothetical protein